MTTIVEDYEALRAKLAQSEKLLADEKGRALAATRDRDQIKREAEKIKIEAAAYRVETDAMIATAGDQLKAAMAVSTAIYYLGQFGRQMLERKANTARAIHREEKTWIATLDALIQATRNKNQTEIDRLCKLGESKIAVVRNNSEALRLEIEELCQSKDEVDLSKKIWEIVCAV